MPNNWIVRSLYTYPSVLIRGFFVNNLDNYIFVALSMLQHVANKYLFEKLISYVINTCSAPQYNLEVAWFRCFLWYNISKNLHRLHIFIYMLHIPQGSQLLCADLPEIFRCWHRPKFDLPHFNWVFDRSKYVLIHYGWMRSWLENLDWPSKA